MLKKKKIVVNSTLQTLITFFLVGHGLINSSLQAKPMTTGVHLLNGKSISQKVPTKADYTIAIEDSNLTLVKELLSVDDSLVKSENFLFTAFWQLNYGDKKQERREEVIEIINLLIKSGVPLDQKVTTQQGAIQESTEHDLYETINLLLEYGDVRELNKESLGNNAIFHAQSRKMLDYLLTKNIAKITDLDESKKSVLYHMVEHIGENFDCSNMEELEQLVGIVANQKHTALWHMADYGSNDKIFMDCFYKILALRDDLSQSEPELFNESLSYNMLGRKFPLEAFEKVIAKGDNINAVDTAFKYESAIFVAIRHNRSDVVALFLKHKAEINLANKKKETPLTLAIRENNLEIVKLLINAGADVNVQTKRYETPLSLAEKENNVEMLAFLKKHSAKKMDTSEQDKKRYIQEYYAAIDSGNVKRVKELVVSKKVDVNTPAGDGQSLIRKMSHHSGMYNKPDYLGETIAFLIEQGATIDSPKGLEKDLFSAALQNNRFHVINALLNRGVKPEGREMTKDFVYLKDKKIINKLLKINPELLYTQGDFGGTIFSSTKALEDPEFFKFLVSKGDVKHRDASGFTMLHLFIKGAADKPQAVSKIKTLLRMGSDLNAKSNNNSTTFMFALEDKASLKLVKYLVKKGLDFNAKNDNNWYVAHAATYASPEVIKYLIRKGMDINVVDFKHEQTPLIHAIKSEKRWIVESLITSKNINMVDFHGKRALNYGLEDGNKNVITLLKKAGATTTTADEIALTVKANQNKIRSIYDAIRLKDYASFETYFKKKHPNLFDIAQSVCNKGDLKMLKFLETQGLKLNAKNKEKYTLLHYSVFYNNIKITKYLFTHGLEKNYLSENGRSVFILAVNSSIEMLKLLESSHVKASKSDRKEFVSEAVRYERLELASYAIKKGYPFSLAPYQNRDVVGDIVRKGELDTVKFLLANGVKLEDKFGWMMDKTTMLLYAQKFKQTKIVDYLLEQGADIYARNGNSGNDRFVDVVFNRGDIKRYEQIKKMGFNINKKGAKPFDKYPLAVALFEKHVELAELLLKDGSRIDVTVFNFSSPLNLAASRGYLKIVKMLIERGADPLKKDSRDLRAIGYAKDTEQKEVVTYLSSFE